MKPCDRLDGRRIIRVLAASVVCGAVLFGCASPERPVRIVTPEKVAVEEVRPDAVLPAPSLVARWRSLALIYEQSEQLRKALLMWRVVESTTHDEEAARRIEGLEKRIRAEGEEHLSKGVRQINNHSVAAARKEFLLALMYDPQQKEALDYLVRKIPEPSYVSYETREGDTVRKIAASVYGDPGKAIIVAYFNDLSGEGQLPSGMHLRMPAIESEEKTRKEPVRKAKVVTAPPVYDKTAAEKHYSEGVSHFLADEFQEAAKEWEETLRLYPDHPNARRDLRKVQSLLKKKG
jgi:hypothetical protein